LKACPPRLSPAERDDGGQAINIEVGLLLNFGRTPEFKRVVYDNKRKNISGNLPATLSLARRGGQRKSAAKQLGRNKP